MVTFFGSAAAGTSDGALMYREPPDPHLRSGDAHVHMCIRILSHLPGNSLQIFQVRIIQYTHSRHAGRPCSTSQHQVSSAFRVPWRSRTFHPSFLSIDAIHSGRLLDSVPASGSRERVMTGRGDSDMRISTASPTRSSVCPLPSNETHAEWRASAGTWRRITAESGKMRGRNESVCGHTGVKRMHGTDGATIGPPALSLRACACVRGCIRKRASACEQRRGGAHDASGSRVAQRNRGGRTRDIARASRARPRRTNMRWSPWA